MAAFSRLELAPNLRAGLGPEFSSNLLGIRLEAPRHLEPRAGGIMMLAARLEGPHPYPLPGVFGLLAEDRNPIRPERVLTESSR